LKDIGLKEDEDFFVYEEEQSVLEAIDIFNNIKGEVTIGIKFP
jgi:hypothetical protein